jgi:hypothetical protein
MATQSNKREFPSFFADTKSAETLRRQFIEAPLETAGQSALGSGIEMANLLSILPAAFVASQERELKRVLSSGIKNDLRVAALESSIEQAGVLQTMAQRGQARIERALAAVAGKDHVFHGFVSNAALAPLKGLRVRLTGSKATRSKELSTTTDYDGYFSIALGTKGNKQQDSGAEASKISLAQRISDLMDDPGIEPISTPSESAKEDASQVEILKKGKLVHSDPVLVARDQGSVYREYVISTEEPPSASDFRKFMAASKPSSKPTNVSSSKRTPKRSADAGSAKGKPKK